MKNLLIVFILLNVTFVKSQKFNSKIDKDSLYNVVLNRIPIEKRDEFKKTYNEGSSVDKDFLLFMLSMSISSKDDLINNFEQKKTEVLKLKSEYNKIIPSNYEVEIEFNPENKFINEPKSIDLKIFRKKLIKKNSNKKDISQEINDSELVSQNWNLEFNSSVLKKEMKKIGWDQKTLKYIQKLLIDANCISIKNGKITNIGFARSGMGKYFYNIFENKLSQKEISEFNDGCTFIYYKDNIVLEYGGGAVGPQCFPDNK